MTSVGAGRELPLLDIYAEREERIPGWLDDIEQWLTKAPAQSVDRLLRRRALLRSTGRIAKLAGQIEKLSDKQLSARAQELRPRLRRHGLTKPNIEACFALVREIAGRTIGLRHNDRQILGGLAMLDGRVAEMATGEGKTLMAALTASTAALAGLPVHVITVNDYLAGRDHETLRPIYAFFGLRTAVIVSGMSHEDRAAAYGCDIVHASNKEIAFDYLRDRIALGGAPRRLRAKLRGLDHADSGRLRTVMRGLHFALVDEADSAFVDEARTPLIISQETEAEDERILAEQAFHLVEDFRPDEDYRLIPQERYVDLTPAGRERARKRGAALGGIWVNHVRCDESARQALSALLLFRRGEHYLVSDGKVQIVDEFTGRIMADRSWSNGLHQLIEHKEGCEITSRKLTMARMTYQRFFRRYLRLCGMTGTAREVRSELWSVYGLRVMRIAPFRRVRRRRERTLFCTTSEAKWDTVVKEVRTLHMAGRPVLVGTRSVAASKLLSDRLQQAGIVHSVLNAEQSEQEASVIAEAGKAGRVTVATNMAGRGVDIMVDPAALEMGGLHVMLSERHDARRIDRQMEGRTGRRGEPGSTRTILSLEDPLLDLLPKGLRSWAGKRRGPVMRSCSGLLFVLAQRRAEMAHGRERRNLLAQDRRLGTLLAFSGRSE